MTKTLLGRKIIYLGKRYMVMLTPVLNIRNWYALAPIDGSDEIHVTSLELEEGVRR